MFEMMLALKRKQSGGRPGPVIPDPPVDIASSGSAMVYIDNTVYIMGGVNNSGTRLRNLTSYNTDTGIWSNLATIPAAVAEVNYARAVAINNDIWMFPPAKASVGVIAVYNVTTGTWRTLPNTSVSGINTTMGVATDGSRYVWAIGGSAGAGIGGKLLQVYDIQTNDWARLPDAANARNYGTITYCNGKLYVQGAPAVDVMDYLNVYDIPTGQWEPNPVSSRPRLDATVLVTVGNKIVSLTGFQGQLAPVEVYVYDTGTGETYSPGKIPLSRFFSCGCSTGTKVWYAGGNGGTPAITKDRMLALTTYVID